MRLEYKLMGLPKGGGFIGGYYRLLLVLYCRLGLFFVVLVVGGGDILC